jgi:hypothetical protein
MAYEGKAKIKNKEKIKRKKRSANPNVQYSTVRSRNGKKKQMRFEK